MQIQTQLFHTLYYTDSPVLLGAPVRRGHLRLYLGRPKFHLPFPFSRCTFTDWIWKNDCC